LSKEQGRAIDTNMEGAGPREPECFGTACVVLTLRHGAATELLWSEASSRPAGEAGDAAGLKISKHSSLVLT
jgi:hypothetical protein